MTPITDRRLSERERRATDHIGRGTYTGPRRRAADARVNRYASAMQARAEDAVLDALYEEAADNGDIGYMRATRTDPGCYTEEIDLEMGALSLGTEDDLDELVAEVKATVRGRTLFEGMMAFSVRASGYMEITDREEY